MVIEISINRDLAADQPGFMAGCAERGHRVEVFSDSHERSESDSAETPDRRDVPDTDIGRAGRCA